MASQTRQKWRNLSNISWEIKFVVWELWVDDWEIWSTIWKQEIGGWEIIFGGWKIILDGWKTKQSFSEKKIMKHKSPVKKLYLLVENGELLFEIFKKQINWWLRFINGLQV